MYPPKKKREEIRSLLVYRRVRCNVSDLVAFTLYVIANIHILCVDLKFNELYTFECKDAQN